MTEESHPTLSEAIEEALAVFTAFSIPLYQNHNGRPSLHGTGFIVRTGRAHYLVSAAHVMDTARESGLFFYTSPRTTRKLTGQLFRTHGSDRRQDDLIDIGVLKLTDEGLPPYPDVGKYAIDIDYLHPRYTPRTRKSYAIIGFPATKSRTNPTERTVLAAPHAFRCSSIDDGQYRMHGVTPETHVVLDLDLRRGYGPTGEHRLFPKPQGMSGAPIMVLYSDEDDDSRVFPVVAVGTTYRKRQRVLIGTDIGYVLDAIESAA